jgi:hypothetical protein
MSVNYQWNGQPCKAKFLNAEINKIEVENMPWWKPFEGTIRRVLMVTPSWGDPFFIDNEDGLGYSKLTNGGMWNHGSRHFEPGSISVVGLTPADEIVTEFSAEKYAEINATADAYWEKERPEDHARLQKMIKSMKKSGL